MQHNKAPVARYIRDDPGKVDNSGSPRADSILGQLTACGVILIVGYLLLFCLMQAPAFWYDLRPDPVRSLFPQFFGPVNALFSDWWVNLDRTYRLALATVPVYLLMVILITGPVLYMLRRVTPHLSQVHTKPALRIIVGFTLAIMLILLFQRGLLSSDIYNYTWYSRIWVIHGASPYTHVPVAFPPDLEGSIYWIGWPNETAVYGPAWLMISAVFYKIGQLVGGTFSAQLLSLRLLADGAHLLNAYLVWKIAGIMFAGSRPTFNRTRPALPSTRICTSSDSHDPGLDMQRSRVVATHARGARHTLDLRFAALLFYIWNPLMLVEFAGNGHNDVVMLTFVLLAVWLYLKGWWQPAALALGVATLVKLPALLFVPGFLWLLLWDGARAAKGTLSMGRLVFGARHAVQAFAIILAAWIVLYIPFWEGLRTLQPLVSGPSNRFYLHSLPAAVWWNAPELLANIFAPNRDHQQFMESIRQFLGANLRIWFMGLLGLAALAITWRARTFNRALVAWGWVALLTIMTQGWFWPWYVSWAVAIAAIAPSRRLRNTTLIFTVSALLHYVEEQILSQHFKLFLDWSGVFIMAPPLIYALVSWVLEVGRGWGLGVKRSRVRGKLERGITDGGR